MANFLAPPVNTAVDENGRAIARPWLMWFQSLYNTVTALFNNLGGTGTAPPSTGYYTQRTIVFNTNPTVQGSAGSQYVVVGWICVASGTPGTWATMRTLTGT